MATSLLFVALIISLVNGQEPTDAPTLEPTKPPTPNFNNLNYDACVIGDNIGGGSMIVSFSRNIEYDIVEITMKGADNRWFGFGMFFVIFIYYIFCDCILYRIWKQFNAKYICNNII